MSGDTSAVINKVLSDRIKRIIFDAFGGPADIVPLPGAVAILPRTAACPFGVRLTAVTADRDLLAVRWRWTVDGKDHGDEQASEGTAVPTPVLETALASAVTASARKTLEDMKQLLQDLRAESPETATALIREKGIGIVTNRLEPEYAFLERTSEMEREASRQSILDTRELPPYCIINKSDAQAIACFDNGALSVLPYIWTRETGILKA